MPEVSWADLASIDHDVLVAVAAIETPASGTDVQTWLDDNGRSVDKSCRSRSLSRLTQYGLVKQTRSTNDLRQTQYRLTTAGQTLLDERVAEIVEALGGAVATNRGVMR